MEWATERAGFAGWLVDLPDWVAGQVVDNGDRHGQFRPRQPTRQVVEEFFAGDSGVGVGDDVGDRHLAVHVVGTADDRCFEHRAVLCERVLDLSRVQVLAASDDHVLDAVHERQVAVVVEHPDVAGVQPAVADGPRRRSGQVQVAAHDAGPGDDDFAGDTGRQRRPHRRRSRSAARAGPGPRCRACAAHAAGCTPTRTCPR